jgi:hypothetical protein
MRMMVVHFDFPLTGELFKTNSPKEGAVGELHEAQSMRKEGWRPSKLKKEVSTPAQC